MHKATKPRKKDKRSVETEASIKECMLSSLETKRFADLTVSEICRKVGITRATFYQHYDNLSDVLDEVLDDMTGEMSDVPLEMCESCSGMFDAHEPAHEWLGMPLCHFYASRNPYRPLLEDNSITERIVERVVECNLDDLMRSIRKRHPSTNIEMPQLRYLNIFRISGCLAAAKAAKRNGYDWSLVQPTLDSAIAAAFETLD